MQWLSDKVLTHPDLAEIEDIGTTYEGKIQRMIKVCTHQYTYTPN